VRLLAAVVVAVLVIGGCASAAVESNTDTAAAESSAQPAEPTVTPEPSAVAATPTPTEVAKVPVLEPGQNPVASGFVFLVGEQPCTMVTEALWWFAQFRLELIEILGEFPDGVWVCDPERVPAGTQCSHTATADAVALFEDRTIEVGEALGAGVLCAHNPAVIDQVAPGATNEMLGYDQEIELVTEQMVRDDAVESFDGIFVETPNGERAYIDGQGAGSGNSVNIDIAIDRFYDFVRIEFDLIAVGPWQGYTSNLQSLGGIEVDHQQIGSIATVAGSVQTWGGPPDQPALTGATDINSLGWAEQGSQDAVFPMSAISTPTRPDLFSFSLNVLAPNDETSGGFDNLRAIGYSLQPSEKRSRLTLTLTDAGTVNIDGAVPTEQERTQLAKSFENAFGADLGESNLTVVGGATPLWLSDVAANAALILKTNPASFEWIIGHRSGAITATVATKADEAVIYSRAFPGAISADLEITITAD